MEEEELRFIKFAFKKVIKSLHNEAQPSSTELADQLTVINDTEESVLSKVSFWMISVTSQGNTLRQLRVSG